MHIAVIAVAHHLERSPLHINMSKGNINAIPTERVPLAAPQQIATTTGFSLFSIARNASRISNRKRDSEYAMRKKNVVGVRLRVASETYKKRGSYTGNLFRA